MTPQRTHHLLGPAAALAMVMTGGAAITTIGCEDEPDSFEDLGREMDEGLEELGDEMEELGDEMEEAGDDLDDDDVDIDHVDDGEPGR